MNWEAIARSLPIGGVRRIKHGHCAHDNLLIRNERTRWSMYCMYCKESQWKSKTCISRGSTTTTPVAGRLTCLPADLQNPPEDVLAKILWKYGILDPAPYKARYSPSMDRLYLLRSADDPDWSGRACHPTKMKWLHGAQYSLLEPSKPSARVVIVEDLISALRVRKAVPEASVLCSHGTALSRQAKRAIIAFEEVYLAYDGDEAGAHAYNRVRKELAPFCTVKQFPIPEGSDPKDLPLDTLKEIWNEAVR